MATYNEYEDKEALIVNPSIPDINKVKADDMNYIKYALPHIGTSVNSSYRTNILHSKNLFSGIPTYYNNATQTNINNGKKITSSANTTSFVLYKMIDVSNFVGSKIAVKCNFSTSGNLGRYIIGLCDENGGNRIAGQQTETSGTTIIYTIPTITTSKYLALWLYAPNTANAYTEYTNIMVNFGEASDYEPYITPSIVVDNDEIYSKPVVLWNNSSPTSSFAGQQITLNDDISNYSEYEIKYLAINSSNYILSTGRIPSNYLTRLQYSWEVNRGRNISSVSTNKITFGNGLVYASYNGSSTDNNNVCVPIQILGYK